MIDAQGRTIEYVRLSLTQRCNLNCVYCNPAQADGCDLLTAAEIEKIIAVMARLGIHKVRLTGGEPLLRADLDDIVRRIHAIPGIQDIPITTNAVGLEPRLKALHDAGVTRLNISLDSLDRDKYRQITGADGLHAVLAAIDKALELQLSVKINVVLIRGTNDDEIDDFIDFARGHALDVRFIELMPIGRFGEENQENVITSDEVLSAHPELAYVEKGAAGVAELYTGPGFLGRVGFISPVSHKFCNTCNRIRLTADGMLKPCLGDNGEVDLRPLLRDNAALEKAIHDAIYNKPKGHCFESGYHSERDMKRIGG